VHSTSQALRDVIAAWSQALSSPSEANGDAKDTYAFWRTQPVAQFNEDPSGVPVRCGLGVYLSILQEFRCDLQHSSPRLDGMRNEWGFKGFGHFGFRV
jgi:hypothetical protein